MKNILIIGASSELAQRTIDELKNVEDINIYTTSRQTNIIDERVKEFHLDVTNVEEFLLLKDRFKNIEFETIINFAGIAIAGAIEELNETELKKQLEVNLFGFLRIIKYLSPLIQKKGKLINVSSMASYGVFPFIAPYCISKAAADILLNLFSVESNIEKGIKIVSIRPGAIATKFWESSLVLNEQTLKESKKFQNEMLFLKKNVQKNSLKAKNPINTAQKIASIVQLKNPKTVYNIGMDAKIASLTRFLPNCVTNNLIRCILKSRLKKENK